MKTLALVSVILILALFKGISQDNVDYEQLWLTNFSLAQDSAIKSQKPILIYFSGSDWCKPCIKFHSQVLATKEFMDFATGAFVLVHADFPYHKSISKEQRKHNDALAEKYNTEGSFPKLVVVSPNDKIIYSCGYKDIKPKQFIDILKSDAL
jgi:thioredoxin-related protein